MVVKPIAASQEDHYLAVFQTQITKSAWRILKRVQQAEQVLPPQDEKQALHTLNYALNLPAAWPITGTLLITMAPMMEQMGRRDEWMAYLEAGIQLSQTLKDQAIAAELGLQLGILYELRGKYEEAYCQLDQSVLDFEQLSDGYNQARALNRLAYVARQQRYFDEAIKFANAALSLLDEQDMELAFSYFVLGTISLDKRDWPKAANLFKEAASLWNRYHNNRMQGRSLLGFGAALCLMKKHTDAISVYQNAILLFERVGDDIHKAIAQMNLGIAYFSLSQYEEGLSSYWAAEKVFRQTKDLLRLAQINHNIGIVYRTLKQWDEAKKAFLTSIHLKEKIGNVVSLVNTMDELGLVYLGQGQIQTAINIFENALSQLVKIKSDPNYEPLLKMITDHLEELDEPMK